MNYIVYDKDGNILKTVTCDGHHISAQGEYFIEGTASDVYQYVANGVIVDYTEKQIAIKKNIPFGYKWDITTMSLKPQISLEEIKTYLSTKARRTRDTLLTECDWTQILDQPESTKLKWQPYRQELRDITAQEGFPDNIIWPIKPS